MLANLMKSVFFCPETGDRGGALGSVRGIWHDLSVRSIYAAFSAEAEALWF